MPDFSDYIVYADESGDHGLMSIDPEFPVFALVLSVIRKEDYVAEIVPSVQRFKFDFWGHDAVILHEHDISKSKREFTMLLVDPEIRERFYTRLNGLMKATSMTIIATVIDKLRLMEKYANPQNPYAIALGLGMEQLVTMLQKKGQVGKTVHCVFESRGRNEDRKLEAEFRRICCNTYNNSGGSTGGHQFDFRLIFQPKSANSTGLQLADLTVRPIALQALRPGQKNRAYEIIRPKLERIRHFP